MVLAGLFKQGVFQFYSKTRVKKGKELLWFVFCSHIRVRVEDVSLQECVAAWKQEAAVVCFCLGW